MSYYITIKKKAPKAEHFIINKSDIKEVSKLLSKYHQGKEKKEKKEVKEKNEDYESLDLDQRDKLVEKIYKKLKPDKNGKRNGSEAVRQAGYIGKRPDQEWQRVKKRIGL
jgi:hypothetical protein